LVKPEEAERAATFRESYRQLKAYDKHISFVVVTGIIKYLKGGLFSASITLFVLAKKSEGVEDKERPGARQRREIGPGLGHEGNHFC
jgi:hypothetical protein